MGWYTTTEGQERFSALPGLSDQQRAEGQQRLALAKADDTRLFAQLLTPRRQRLVDDYDAIYDEIPAGVREFEDIEREANDPDADLKKLTRRYIDTSEGFRATKARKDQWRREAALFNSRVDDPQTYVDEFRTRNGRVSPQEAERFLHWFPW